jgi:5-methyltetrahydropteroyltriglutamate--homocysteine methyltransferase
MRDGSMNDRILTTHVGSLPRGELLTDLLIRDERGESIDRPALEQAIRAGMRDVIQAQVEAGIDIINDGEQSRPGFQTYVVERMEGFGGESRRPRPRDYLEFPIWASRAGRRFTQLARVSNAPKCIGEVRYTALDAAIAECEGVRNTVQEFTGRYVDRFMTAASPGIIATTMLNEHYETHERYVFALAREMKAEYEAIVHRGFILQIDAPDLAMERTMLYQDQTLPEFLSLAEIHIAALNEAILNIPFDRLRMHVCYGNWEGPHTHDVPLIDILPIITQARVGGLSVEFANPRHQHEYGALRQIKLPDQMVLIPGVVDSTTNYVEHPQVIKNRILEAVAAVGDRSRVIAGMDCGFGTFAGYEFVAPDVVWAKFRACAEGAAMASRHLWGR